MTVDPISHPALAVLAPGFTVRRGQPTPLGARPSADGMNFAVYASRATGVCLVLCNPATGHTLADLNLDPEVHRTGAVWHILITGLCGPVGYGYRVQPPEEGGTRSENAAPMLLLDPYARSIAGRHRWGHVEAFDSRPEGGGDFRLGIAGECAFDWGDDQHPSIPLADSIIYELHVRGFTHHPSSATDCPGTFAGLVEKIPYLVELGITAVELLPVTEFEETDCRLRDPDSGEQLVNYWGYHPVALFAPKASFAASGALGGQVAEFKSMVKALHAANIEVILDIVFNHTGEGDEDGPTYSFRGIDNQTYYMVDSDTGLAANYSGCGNTVNCNHPVVQDLILDCLRYWVQEMHVDGFRFDLATILCRGEDGQILTDPPLVKAIAVDPILAQVKLIAEPWDAAGGYQVGTFPAHGRWAEWNGLFRDDIRRFVSGERGIVAALAERLSGSPDLYGQSDRGPSHSINFVTCHDGFTLRDLTCYEQKCNRANGEDNRDGSDHNLSWNCGVEGPTDDCAIQRLRQIQAKNFATLMLVSAGVPMLLAGDEFGRTQRGNNNAYCQDFAWNWIDWRQRGDDAGLWRFFQSLISLRLSHPELRPGSYDLDVTGTLLQRDWHGVELGKPDWSSESLSLAMHVYLRGQGAPVGGFYVIANSYWERLTFQLPKCAGSNWLQIIDTAADAPYDFHAPGNETRIAGEVVTAQARSMLVLKSPS